MNRVILLPILVAFACLAAGLYGALHNQISYTVGPDYFHAFKFHQFAIPETQHGRIGAALVGWRASWWMGLVIGVPVGLMSLLMPTVRRQIRGFLVVTFVVVGLTLAIGAASLLLPNLPAHQELISIPAGVADEQGFMRAALMHSFSYLGGLISTVLGLILLAVMAVRARRG